MRQRTRGLVNPISVPTILAAPGMALENWSGSEAADAPWLMRARRAARPARVRADRRRSGCRAAIAEAARRALLFDLRNLGTLGLQQDSFPGLLWADAITGHAGLSTRALEQIPPLYAAASVRAMLALPFARPRVDPAAAARGRALFAERVAGVIANRQILKLPPRSPATASLDGPVVAPIDATRPLGARLAVRCADCHAAAPLENVVALADHPPPLGRCSHCHLAHPALAGMGRGEANRRYQRRASCRSPRCQSAARRPRSWRSAKAATAGTATSGRWSTRRAASFRSTPTETATPS